MYTRAGPWLPGDEKHLEDRVESESFWFFLSLLILRERERASTHAREGQREREREQESEAGSAPSVRSPMWGLELTNREIMT